MEINVEITPISECAVLVRVIDCRRNTPQLLGLLTEKLYQQYEHCIMNVTPSVESLLVDYLPHRVSLSLLTKAINNMIATLEPNTLDELPSAVIKLPVFYHHDVAPDLERYQQKGLSLDALISAHTRPIYTVAAIGFAPGFAFLQEVAHEIRLPRHVTPRLSVPKGSVGIAENRTAVYPSDSPGGWNIIGNCPVDLYQPDKQPMMPFSIGSRVQFFAINRQEFLSLGGKLDGEFL